MSYRLEIGLALLLGAAIGIAIWAAQRSAKPPSFDPRASTFLSGPQGSKGLHEVQIRLKRPSERRRTALFDLASNRSHRPAVLVVLNPPIPLQDAELEQVVQFVRSGGAVVAAGNGGGITRCSGWALYPDSFRSDSVAVRSPQPGLRLPRIARTLAPRKADDVRREQLENLKKGGGENTGCTALVPLALDTIIATRDGRPVILRLTYRSGGSITLAADAGWFRNRLWRDTDVSLVVLPLLATKPGHPGRVVWDEYHQGFAAAGGVSLAGRTWSWLTESPAGWAILQLIAVALVWLAVTAVRFGPARAVIERRRRSALEHLEALAAGLEGGNAADTAVQRLAAGLGRRLGGRAGHDLESLDLAMRDAHGHAAVRRLRHLLNEHDRSNERVLATAQAVEDVWEELRPRKTRNA